jgi:hypothetical protein
VLRRARELSAAGDGAGPPLSWPEARCDALRGAASLHAQLAAMCARASAWPSPARGGGGGGGAGGRAAVGGAAAGAGEGAAGEASGGPGGGTAVAPTFAATEVGLGGALTHGKGVQVAPAGHAPSPNEAHWTREAPAGAAACRRRSRAEGSPHRGRHLQIHCESMNDT